MARLVFFNRFYWPDEPATAQLLVDLAEALAADGHEVAVVTSRPAGSPVHAERNRVCIHRVRSLRVRGKGLLSRILDVVTFYPGAFLLLLQRVKRRDVLVAMTDPPLSGILAAAVARLRGAKLVHWVQDIYPEIAVLLTRQRWLMASRPPRDAAWRAAHACFVPGETMADALRSAQVPDSRIVVSPNWAPAGLRPPDPAHVAALREQWGLTGKFVAAYSGNLGRVHDLDPLIEVASLLQHDPTFAFVFIGGGAGREPHQRAIKERRLTNVHFHPAQPRERLSVSLGVGDVHFVTLKPGAERAVFPSKLYGIAQIGRPVLFVGARDSDVARNVTDHRFGAVFTRDESPAIAAWLTQLRSDPERHSQLSDAALAFAPRGQELALQQWRQFLATPDLAAPSPHF